MLHTGRHNDDRSQMKRKIADSSAHMTLALGIIHDFMVTVRVYRILEYPIACTVDLQIHSVTPLLLFYHKSIFYTSSFINSPTYPCA